MFNRHKIRETAVQMLYSFQLEGVTHPEPTDYESFWNILMERESDKLLEARTNAIEHLTQDRGDKLAVFEKRIIAALAALPKAKGSEQLIDLLQDIQTREHTWTVRQHSLFSLSKSTLDDKEGAWPLAMEEFFATNAALYEFRKQLIAQENDFPALRYVTAPLVASAKKMQLVAERVLAVAHPLDYPENNDVRHLRNTEKELNQWKVDTTELGGKIFHMLPIVDDAIERYVENYTPERLSAVDRAVLRLGSYELLFCKELPLPVVISEAVEIASRFSGSDSAKFVNGVLDKVGKSITND